MLVFVCLFGWFWFLTLCVFRSSVNQGQRPCIVKRTYGTWNGCEPQLHFSTAAEGNFRDARKEGRKEGRNGGRKEGRMLPYPWLNKKPIRTNSSPINISQNGCTRSPMYRNTLHTGLTIAVFCDGGWRHGANEIDVHGLMSVIWG